MNECNDDFENVYLKNNPLPEPGYCVIENSVKTDWSKANYNASSYCIRSALTWAVGSSDIQDLPEDLAYPAGGTQNFKYFIFQLHYNNPKKIASNN